jgi:hypothetical protein
MTQQQVHTPLQPPGKLNNTLFDASIGDVERMVSILDGAIPLQGASHADVLEYVVEIPLSYAECFALLSDGRKVALQNSRHFVGWSTHDRDRSLLFCSNGELYEVAVEAGLLGQSPGCVRTVFLEAAPGQRSSIARKFIGIDGDVVILPTPSAPN